MAGTTTSSRWRRRRSRSSVSLGTRDQDKKHVIYEAGHDLPHKEEVRESLDWLDKYLGPVRR